MEQTKLTSRAKNSYIFAAAGQGAIYAMISSWALRFFTDVAGLELVFVTALMWFAKILNAFADPVVGIIVDKTESKRGKMRPYLKFMPFVISLLSILIFIDIGDVPQVWKCIYCGVIYVAWGIAYSFADVPFWGLPCVLTNDGEERDKLFSVAKLLNAIGGAIPSAAVALMISDSVLGLEKGILFSAIVIIGISCIPFSLVYPNTREISHPNTAKSKTSVQKEIKLVLKNKILLLVMLSGILGFGRYLIQAAYTYAASYVFTYSSEFVENFSQVIGLALIGIGMFPTMILTPRLVKKFSYKVIMIAAGLVSVVIFSAFYIVEIVTNYNFYWALAFLFISGLPLGVLNIVVTSVIGECIDYLEWKENVRLEGMMASMSTFVAKIGNAISAGSIPLILAVSGYEANVVQTVKTKNCILALISIIPAISLFLSAIPMFFYTFVGKKREQALLELKERREKAEENNIEEVVLENSSNI
jgi:sugar (glycoside-pentoside-hexuronide) transporter